MEAISISKGNLKLKSISSFSLTPIKSCVNFKYCSKKCYALKAYKAYPNTKKAYDRNFRIAKDNLKELKKQLINYLRDYKQNYFRIHVAGDFFSQEYLDMWKEICKEFINIKFLAYTKAYNLKFTNKSENLEIVFSTFDTMEKNIDELLMNKFKMPIARAGTENPDKEKYLSCAYNCSICKYCWHLSELKKNVFFKYH